jgi:uncharacterized membrane protein
MSQRVVIIGLFSASYVSYYLREPIVLAFIYPVAISYYNVLMFRELIHMKSVQAIAIAMVGVGWIATSAANLIALEHHLWLAGIVLVVFTVSYPFYFRRIT